jgi:hypothetical protein
MDCFLQIGVRLRQDELPVKCVCSGAEPATLENFVFPRKSEISAHVGRNALS